IFVQPMNLTTIAALEPAGRSHVPTSVLYVTAAHDQASVAAKLSQMGLDVTSASDAAAAVRALKARPFTLALIQLTDDRGAVAVVRAIRAQQPHLLMAGLMDAARPFVATDAIRAGVGELISWPLDPHDVAALVSNARDQMAIAFDEPGHATA